MVRVIPTITRWGRGLSAGVELVTFVVSITVLQVGCHRHPSEIFTSSFCLPLYFQLLANFISLTPIFGLINALWVSRLRRRCASVGPSGLALGHVGRCQCGSNEPFRIPLYEQLRDCRSQSLYWVSYL